MRHLTVVRVRLFSDICHVMTKAEENLTCMYTVWLKHMTTYKRIKPATAGPVADIYLELKMLCLFYFALESEKKMATMSRLQWYLKNNSIFPLFILVFLNFNSQCQLNLVQFINVIATNNNLLMDELNVSYFDPKLWLYVTIWLPQTTDNSTHFAQSLEIRGIESRLYLQFHRMIEYNNTCFFLSLF